MLNGDEKSRGRFGWSRAARVLTVCAAAGILVMAGYCHGQEAGGAPAASAAAAPAVPAAPVAPVAPAAAAAQPEAVQAAPPAAAVPVAATQPEAVKAAEPSAAPADDLTKTEIMQILDRLAARIAKGGGEGKVEAAAPAKMTAAEAVSMAGVKQIPAEATALITLSKLSKVEINEMAEQLCMGLGSELSYVSVVSTLSEVLPAPPSGLIGDRTVARIVEGKARVLRFGYRHFVTQPPQLWVMGVIVEEDGGYSANPDIALVEPEIKKLMAGLAAMRAGLEVRDLEAKLIQLSYADADTALGMLKGLGITTVASAAAIPAKVEYAALPYVAKIEDPKADYTGLLGGKTGAGGKLSMSPGEASAMADNAIATPMTQLLVMFHPAHPEQFSEVRSALDNYIDRPARQIFIEAMVLEISEQGLKDLGVEWSLHPYFKDDGTGVISKLRMGSTSAEGAGTDTLNLVVPNTSTLHNVFTGQFQWDWELTLRALIRSGKAQVLSRPSVLTLDNRQSTIRVGTDIPIASSLQGAGYSSLAAFKFEYLPIGILLNIRPRITEDGREVTMLIDTMVSAKVPNENLKMYTSDGKSVLAEAPTVSTRRVQTYGRITNNTPLIIGGLVNDEKISTRDKVPLLGDLPVVGALFRAEKTETQKREVIIVLTPHVLPEKREVRRSYPKDEDAFDNFGNNLFRDSYRIRGEDVFDLTFLLENQRISMYRQLAREVAEKDFRLGAVEPFRSFVRDSVPGEDILVTRMIYEVIKRLNIADPVDESRIIYFGSQQVGGYTVKFLDGLLKKNGEDKLKDFGDKALAITYHRDSASLEEGHLGSEPIPVIDMVDCADKDAWGTKLWELNQPTEDGRERYTILIKDESDIVRLRRALALKRIVDLNGGVEHLRLKNFSVGKTLLMPELKKDQIHVIDADTAMFFFHTEHYYAAGLAEIEKQLKELDKMLRRPEVNILLDSEVGEFDSDGE
jgi:general secretion pathway protein D